MRKIVSLFACSFFALSLFAQDNPSPKKKKTPINLNGRANDHFMIQLGSAAWSGKPDSIHTKGLSKSFNVYFMFDFPFKTNPHLSVAVGAGVGSDQMYFDKTYVGIKDNTPTIYFVDQADTNHFKKTKLATAWVEAPVELRYAFDPANINKSFKIALGVKVGALLNAHTRSKDYETAGGNVIYSYVQKEASKKFFNGNHLVLSARVGWGHFSLFYNYQFSSLFRENRGPDIKPYSIGLTLSGL
jgi:hypothetical protein